MSNQVAALEAEVQEYKSQLETVQLGIQADPDNAELHHLLTELQEVIALTTTAIAELKPPPAALPSLNTATTTKNPASPVEKWSKQNHPAYQAGYRPPSAPNASAADSLTSPTTSTPATFAVNDTVLAKWKSGDRGFYPARITSITGSTSKPVYIVSFKSYATTETLSAHEIKPISTESKKRKADGPAIVSSPTTTPTPSTSTSTATATATATPSTNGVISAAASIDPTLATQAKKEPSMVRDGPTRLPKVPRKVKANKELEAGKSKWQEFSTKGKLAKVGKKDSMFRTPDGVNARVGFTGSGQEMRKDPSRSKHVYASTGDDD